MDRAGEETDLSNFYAYVSRMRLIRRWGLMRSTQPENDMEHSMQVTMLAHGIGLMAKTRLGIDVDLEKILLTAAYHDAPEVITGDLATPVKYGNAGIRDAFHDMEHLAAERLLDMLPEDLRPGLERALKPDEATREWRIVKAADKLSAYIKCLEEARAGNREFIRAQEAIKAQLDRMELPELSLFMETFGEGFSLTLDEME